MVDIPAINMGVDLGMLWPNIMGESRKFSGELFGRGAVFTVFTAQDGFTILFTLCGSVFPLAFLLTVPSCLDWHRWIGTDGLPKYLNGSTFIWKTFCINHLRSLGFKINFQHGTWIITHMLHLWYFFTYIWVILRANVGINIPYVEHMGNTSFCHILPIYAIIQEIVVVSPMAVNAGMSKLGTQTRDDLLWQLPLRVYRECQRCFKLIRPKVVDRKILL